MLISNMLKKLLKNSCEISYQWKSDGKMKFLTFITLSKRVWPTFFKKSSSNFEFYDTHLNLWKNVPHIKTSCSFLGRTLTKRHKNLIISLYMCLGTSFCIHFRSRRLRYVKICQNRCTRELEWWWWVGRRLPWPAEQGWWDFAS